MKTFRWLHLTDLHVGMRGQDHLWPAIREAFYDDLENLHASSGPWDAVLFTGDLVQKGTAEEFGRVALILGGLWQRLDDLGSQPVLLTVPGNHDLTWPKPTAAVKFLTRYFSDVREELWTDPDSEYRAVVDQAFAAYSDWWRGDEGEDSPWRGDLDVRVGRLPGDFAATWEGDGLRVGLVGLNTTFLQLAPDMKPGSLAWDVRQLHDACGSDGAAWVRDHDVALLLTHQPPNWLDKVSLKAQAEIYPAGRFAVHLCGHQHENILRGVTSGGGAQRRTWQGSALFGMEQYGDEEKQDRRHGYAAGAIEVTDGGADLRHWPRRAHYDDNGWRFVRDEESCVLEEDGGTRESIEVQRRRKSVKPRTARPRVDSRRLEVQRLQASVDAYADAAMRLFDIIDLAGMPEDDRHLAMQKFLVRQLYVPLRVTVEATVDVDAGKDVLEKMESAREQRRLSAAGRGEAPSPPQEPQSVGERLGEVRRLVVLGDPGGGKTTLLRWIATAYLLRRDPKQQDDFAQLPDAGTLPDEDWLPILVRCRELDTDGLKNASLEDLLRQTLRTSQIPEDQVEALVAELRQRLTDGRAILLVDGLDEIADPTIRMAFCRQIEKVAGRYEKAPIVATSRIVGYREMRFPDAGLRARDAGGALGGREGDFRTALVRGHRDRGTASTGYGRAVGGGSLVRSDWASHRESDAPDDAGVGEAKGRQAPEPAFAALRGGGWRPAQLEIGGRRAARP